MSQENQSHITQKQYREFMEHLVWQRLKTPDYRMGQAFLNYFPEVSSNMANSKEGTLLEMKLYYETDEERAKWLINQWVSNT